MCERYDTFNKFGVGINNDKIVLIASPKEPITKTDALVLAAWIVACADDRNEFDDVLRAVKST